MWVAANDKVVDSPHLARLFIGENSDIRIDPNRVFVTLLFARN